jgi:GntR family transcriptional regulator
MPTPPTLDKRSPVPYYLQLAQVLKHEIQTRGVSGARPLPSEAVLVKQYHVSRATVRSALSALERQGLIYRRRGKGSFVAVRRVESELTALVSSSQDMQRRGWDLTTQVLALEQVTPPAKVAQALDLATTARVYALTRLRLVDGQPVSVQTAYLPVSLYPDLETHDLSASLYRLSEQLYHLIYASGREVLRARGATRAEAKMLKLRPGAPVLYCERVTFSQDGMAMEYLEAVWRGDKYDFTVNLTRPASEFPTSVDAGMPSTRRGTPG